MPRKNAGSAKQANVTSRAAPIPSNAEPVSSAARNSKEAAEGEEIGQQDEVACKRHRRSCRTEWNEQHREDGRHQGNDRPRAENPGRRRTEHRILTGQLDEIVVGLQHGWPDSSCKPGFRLVNDAQLQRRGNQRHGNVQRP